MKPLRALQSWLAYLGGSTDERPPHFPLRADWIILALWWAFLIALIAAFCGQTSKFIYIDF